jgi:hypothetical protein
MRHFVWLLVGKAQPQREFDPNRFVTVEFSDLKSPLAGAKSGERDFCLRCIRSGKPWKVIRR